MFCLPVLMLLIQQPSADAAKWQTHELISNDDLAVRLKLRSEASIFEIGWIKLEFENKTRQPLQVTIRCSANAKASPAGSSLLFPSVTERELGGKLAPGVSIAGEELLAWAIANSLRMPPEKGQQVEARIQMRVNSFPPRRLKLMTPRDGVAFAFTWRRPGNEQLAKAREQLNQLLATAPIEQSSLYDQKLHALLAVPELHRDLPTNKVLEALNRFSGDTRRVDLYRALVLPRRKDAAVIGYYRDKIKTGDQAALSDLLHGDWRPIPGKPRAEEVALWDKSFTDAAVALYEQDPRKYELAFAVLQRRNREWSGDAKITARLAAAVHKLYPILDQKFDRLGKQEVEQLMRGIERLGKTRDQASLALLGKAMALDYPSPFPTPMIHFPNYPTGVSVAHQAASAVVEILDKDPHAMSQWIEQHRHKGQATPDDIIAYARDRLSRWEAEAKKKNK